MPRILLILARTSYRAADFLAAAAVVGAEVVVGSDHRQTLAAQAPGGTLYLDLADVAGSVERIRALARERPLDAVLAAEDEGVAVAAAAAAALGLRHNPPAAVRTARHKDAMRAALRAAGVATPWFRSFEVGADPEGAAGHVAYPCVLKPTALSASRGVIRADDADSFARAFRRIARILAEPEVRRAHGPAAERVLVEGYVPGQEVALDGLLESGRLRVLALFDKPDPLEGPFFEETLFITPSRLPAAAQTELERTAAGAAAAIGLREGPIHAELRWNDAGAWPLEVAPRTIGGLCSRSLRFGGGDVASLETLVIRHALGLPVDATPALRASGVLMLPIPRAGILAEVRGMAAAREVEGVEDVVLSIPAGSELRPLPEGNRYLGFVFARAATPAAVEAALRTAQARLEVVVAGTAPALRNGQDGR